MSDQLIKADNVTREMIEGYLRSAFIEYGIDGDGDIVVQDGIKCSVTVSTKQSKIGLLALFGLKPSVDRARLLEKVNLANSEYIFVRACVTRETRSLVFQYDISLHGGILPQHLILTLKRFCSIPLPVVREHLSEFVA